MPWKDIICGICLRPYRNCSHWPGYPSQKPSDEALAEIYHAWKHPEKPKLVEKPKPARVARAVEPRAVMSFTNSEVDEPTHQAAQLLGQRGGASRSERKIAASRKNGLLHLKSASKLPDSK